MFRLQRLFTLGIVLVLLLSLVGCHSKKKAEAPEPEGGMYAFFRVDGVTNSVGFAKDLIDKAGIGLAPGSAFGPEGQGWLRWCFANRPETNAAGLQRLAAYLTA